MELEKLRANGGAEAAASGGAAGARLAEELAAARGRCATLEDDVAKWEAALAARDVELQNLQRALGEVLRSVLAAARLVMAGLLAPALRSPCALTRRLASSPVPPHRPPTPTHSANPPQAS